MADHEPMIKLDPEGRAPILSYSLPEPTSYSGRNFIELIYPEDYFKPELRKPPPRTPTAGQDPSVLTSAVATAMKNGLADRKLFPNLGGRGAPVRFVDSSSVTSRIRTSTPVSRDLAALEPDEVAHAMLAGQRLNVYRSLFGTLKHNYVPEPVKARPRILLVETYRLSSFLGQYGAGRVLKTFTLLPGEKTKVSVKSYTKTDTEAKQASSVLDSFTEESADDFENSVQSEQANQESYAETFEYHAEANASASWGWGSASASGGVSGGTSAAREEFAKNATSALQKHSSKASAKRDVQVNTSYEVKTSTGEETSIEREIQNVNLSRTLNFVFRQMNQEFVSLLHLVDVRVAFFNGFAESRRETSLPQLDGLLSEVLVDSAKVAEVKAAIVTQLENVFDYQGERQSIIEENVLSDVGRYLRVRRGLRSSYRAPASAVEIPVEGIILAAQKSVMRTEGVIVEALLGEGVALDDYARQLQELEVAARAADVEKRTALAQRETAATKAVVDGDAARTSLLAELRKAEKPCCDDVPTKQTNEAEDLAT